MTTEQRARQTFRMTFAIALVGFVTLALLDVGDVLPSLGSAESATDPIDDLWVTVAAALVFMMQGGFLLFEVGLARHNHAPAVAMKNLVDWTVASLAYFVVGFGLMFGSDALGLWGDDLFMLDGLAAATGTTVSGPTFFIFQLAFAGTALTIVSGSLVERTTFLAYVVAAAVMGMLIYPVFGHWAWGGLIDGTDTGWLRSRGFHDFAGSTVVHSIGAWTALAGVVVVGPRLGRYGPDGEVRHFAPSNTALSAMGVVVLWFGWWGFNGGSTLTFDQNVPRIILVTNLAGAAGLLAAGIHSHLFRPRPLLSSAFIGGGLAGLAGITASADAVSPTSAIAIGLVAGLLHNLSADLLNRLRIDDTLGVVPVHGVAGAWGTIAFAIFAPTEMLAVDRLDQFVIQAIGVGSAFIWAGGIGILLFGLLNATIGLRIDPKRELGGLDLFGEDEETPLSDWLDDDELTDLIG